MTWPQGTGGCLEPHQSLLRHASAASLQLQHQGGPKRHALPLSPASGRVWGPSAGELARSGMPAPHQWKLACRRMISRLGQVRAGEGRQVVGTQLCSMTVDSCSNREQSLSAVDPQVRLVTVTIDLHIITLLWLSQQRYRAVGARGTQAPSYTGPRAHEAAVQGAIKTGPSWSQLASAEAVKQLQQVAMQSKLGRRRACQPGLLAAGHGGTGLVCVSRMCLTCCCWDGRYWDWQGCRGVHDVARGLAWAWAPPRPQAQRI